MQNKLLQILNDKKVLEIGSYPPPIGGVSVHIYRLCKNLKNCDIFDWSMKSFFKTKYIKLFFKVLFSDFDIIHLHIIDKKAIQIILLLKKFKNYKIFFTAHNPILFDLIKKQDFIFYKRFIEGLDNLIVVGEHILNKYKKRELSLPKHILVEPAFLPPPLEDEKEILNSYPKSLFEFLNKHKPIIIANASALRFYNDIDLYGLDMCIELTDKLKSKFSNVGFIFSIASENENKKYLEKMRKKIKELNIEDNFYFLIGQKEIWPLFKKVDLMIRPTNTDGDAISIREALYFNTIVIASDITNRPKGTILFKSRDLEDLYEKTSNILKEGEYRL